MSDTAKISESQIRLIFELSGELESMRQKVSMAQVIFDYPGKSASLHPVVNFALSHAEDGVIEHLLLRLAEAADILNVASGVYLGKKLFSKKNRIYTPIGDRSFVDVLQIRHEYIAHRVQNARSDSGSLERVKAEHGTILAFLQYALVQTENVIDQLVEAGIYNGVGNLVARHTRSVPFTEADLARLIEAANALVRSSDSDRDMA